MIPANPICVTLDRSGPGRNVQPACILKELAGMVKLGMEFFCTHGRAGYEPVAAEDTRLSQDRLQ